MKKPKEEATETMTRRKTQSASPGVHASDIRDGMPVVCSEGGQFAVVDHMDGEETIKLRKDDEGEHHFIPLAWVTKVDAHVHVDRPGQQAMRQWSSARVSGITA